jgi:hypothetical protein
MHISEFNFKHQSVKTFKHPSVFTVTLQIIPSFCASSLERRVSSTHGILLGAVTKTSSACFFKAFRNAPSFCLKTSPLWRCSWRHKICKKIQNFIHINVCMYIGFKTFFYVVQHLDSIASYLPTGLHLGFFRWWPSLFLPSSFSSVFLVLSFIHINAYSN